MFTSITRNSRYFPASVPSVSTSGLDPQLISSAVVSIVGILMLLLLPTNSFRCWLDTTALRFAAFEGVVVNEDTHPTKSDDTRSKRMAAAAGDGEL